jgi:hypothetical protein
MSDCPQALTQHTILEKCSTQIIIKDMRTRARPDIDARERLGLNWNAKQREAFLDTVKVVDIERLDVPYPMDGYYVAGTARAKKQWDTCMHVVDPFTVTLRDVGNSRRPPLFSLPFSVGT